MSRWQKSYAKQSDHTLTKQIIRNRACKVCGSTKWVCYSDDRGKTWTCWGHRADATPEQRKREDDRQKADREKKEQYRANVQRKRHARRYSSKTVQSGEYDYMFD